MKIFPFLLLFLFLISCRGDRPHQKIDPASTKTALNDADKPQVKTPEPKNEQSTAVKKVQESPSVPYAGSLTLAAQNIEGRPGEIVCMDITVANFQEVISMQYSLQWDSAVLEYSNVHGFQLPFLSEQNFGTHKSGEGILTFIWIDNTLQGKNLPDGSSIYQACFKVIGQSGQRSHFIITNKPTPFESVNAQEKLLEITTVEGSVEIK